MIIPAVNDVAFTIFGFPVYKYGITMALAIFSTIVFGNFIYNRKNENRNIILDFSPILIISGLVGARLYFCLLNPHFYLANPLEILNFRGGGMSIHGAIIGGILSLVYLSKKTNISILKILDPLACGAILGQAIGRWGNYFNSEAFGKPVLSQNWGQYIPVAKRPFEYVDYSLFHPTFLYESIFDLISFFILLFIYLKFSDKKGVVFCCYLIIYSVIRFVIEGIRVDSALDIAQVPIAQIVSVILFILGVLGLVVIGKKKDQI